MLNFFYLSIYSIFFLLHVIFFNKKLLISINFLIVFFLIVFFGTRYSVGGDFHNYEYSLNLINNSVDRNYELGFLYIFNFLNYFKLNFAVFNIFYISLLCCSLLFFLKKYCKQHVEFLFIISFPIFFLVLGTGSIRQGMAIAFFLIFVSISEKKYILKVFIFFIPFLFHKSAIFLNFIYLLTILMHYFDRSLFIRVFKKNWFFLISSFFIISTLFLIYFNTYFNTYFVNYLYKDQYISIGFYPRVIICLFFSIIIILLNKQKFLMDKYFFLSSLFCFFLFFIGLFFSTIADRLLLYIFPLVFYGINLILNLVKNNNQLFFYKLIIFSIFLFYLFLWENFSPNYYLWDNYENYFF